MSTHPTPNPSRPRVSLLQAVVVSALILALAWVASRGSLARSSAERIPDRPFAHVYVQTKIGEPAKCLVTDRAGATLRRSEPETVGARWKCRWLDGPDGPVLSALTGKEPSFLFVPHGAVFDPIHPLVYERVRSRDELPLPKLRWVHLFHDRIYRGFFLQIRLPDKKWTVKQEMGRAEILETLGDRAWCWNRKLRSACAMWNSSFIAEAIFPQPAAGDGLDLLRHLLVAGGEVDDPPAQRFILGQNPVQDASLWPWPVPVELRRQLAGADAVARSPDDVGSGLAYTDARYRGWAPAGAENNGGGGQDWSAADWSAADWNATVTAQVGAATAEDPTWQDFERAVEVSVPSGALPQAATMGERLAASPLSAWLPREDS